MYLNVKVNSDRLHANLTANTFGNILVNPKIRFKECYLANASIHWSANQNRQPCYLIGCLGEAVLECAEETASITVRQFQQL